MNLPLSAIIKQLRQEKKMTQRELAEALGVTVQAVSKWEKNRSSPDIARLPRLAALFGVSMDALFRTEAQKGPEPHAVEEE